MQVKCGEIEGVLALSNFTLMPSLVLVNYSLTDYFFIPLDIR